MQALILTPLIPSAYYAWKGALIEGFFDVYLSCLFLLPFYYRFPIAGLPDPNFTQCAILPLAILFVTKLGQTWRFSTLDVVVLAFSIWAPISQFLNTGYSDAQNILFDYIAWAFVPYLMAKCLISPNGLDVKFAKRMVFLLCIVVVISVYEFRMGLDLFKQLFYVLIPEQLPSWGTWAQRRWNYGRIAGPFAHAIYCGNILTIGLNIQLWLAAVVDRGPGKSTWKLFGVREPIVKALILLAGLLMTFSRGPWFGSLFALFLGWVGVAENPKKRLLKTLPVLLAIAAVLVVAINQYSNVDRFQAGSEDQESMAYRRELITQYTIIADQHRWTGWGTVFPTVDGMESIDNNYLLLWLRHGLTESLLYLAIILTGAGLLFVKGMSKKVPLQRRCLLLTQAGILIGIGLTTASVNLGESSFSIFFVLVGWAEGCRLTKPEAEASEERAVALPVSRTLVLA